MREGKLRFAIQIDILGQHTWSLGAFITHDIDETYIGIVLVKFSIAIGKMRVYD